MPMLDPEDTICAVASPAGGSIRGVVRISGPGTVPLLSRVLRSATEPSAPWFPPARHCPHRSAALVATESDLGLVYTAVLLWPTERSYTGQPSAELQLIGAEPILQSVIDALVRHGARIAGRGEFTLRSFLAGHLDLVQAEAVLGVIEAETANGLGAALDQLTGGISTPLRKLRQEMLELLADVEAGLDFVEEDIQFIDDWELASRLDGLSTKVRASAVHLASRGRSGECPMVALCGLPNAGKSRLMNAISGMESSIVSDSIGTTTDPVEFRLGTGARRLRIVDTAGIESETGADTSASEIAVQAQHLGRGIARDADVRLWCQDARLAAEGHEPPGDYVRVATKIDLVEPLVRQELVDSGWILTSALTGYGLDTLLCTIHGMSDEAEKSAGVAVTAMRCRETLLAAADGLAAAARIGASGGGHELLAAELRLALDAIGRVTGAVYTDDLLDSIFSRFCIGK